MLTVLTNHYDLFKPRVPLNHDVRFKSHDLGNQFIFFDIASGFWIAIVYSLSWTKLRLPQPLFSVAFVFFLFCFYTHPDNQKEDAAMQDKVQV